MSFYAFYPPSSAGSANASVGLNGDVAPTSSTEVGGINPSGNLQPLQTDVSGNLLVSVQSSPSPQSVNLTQVGGAAITEGQKAMAASLPVVIASNQSTLAVSAASLPLPSGASTSANQATEIASLSSIDGKFGSLGQKAMAGSAPVVISSDQSAIPISGTVSVTGVATAANQTNASQKTQIVDGSGNVIAATSNSLNVAVQSSALPSGAATETTLSTINGKTPSLGQAAMAASSPVVIASNQSAIPVSQSGTWTVQPGNTANTTPWLVAETVAASSAITSVASSATSVSILASNASRKQASVYNDSTQILYLKLGATASSTSYTVQIPANGYYELPNGKIYTGAIDGIWASANGNARITELS